MLFELSNKLVELPTKENAAPDRPEPPKFRMQHFVSANPIAEPFPEHLSKAIFGMGCFWGAERLFWQLPGVYSTAAGYAGGITVNPSYEDVCSGMSGHTEVVLVVFDREQINFEDLSNPHFTSFNFAPFSIKDFRFFTHIFCNLIVRIYK